MTEISLPFNSVDHDRVYDADVIAKKDSYFIPDGVNAQGGALAATADGTNMNVTIADGMAYIQGHFYNNTSSKIMTHATADPTYDRIDRIVARLDKNQGARQITIEIKQGTPAASPVEPSLQSDAYIVEIPIARVLITKALSTISQAKVTDERGTLLDPVEYWTQIATINSQLATKADKEFSWIDATLQNGCTITSGYFAKYGKDDMGNVFIQGNVNGAAVNATIFTLPSGYRPSNNLQFIAACNSNIGMGSAKVNIIGSSGIVRVEAESSAGISKVNLSLNLLFKASGS